MFSKNLKKIVILMMMSFVLLTGGVGNSFAQGPTYDDNGFTEKDIQISEVIMEHLVFDEKTKLFTLVNENELGKKLQVISSDVSLEEIKKDIENINNAIEDLEVEAEGDLEYGTYASMCEIALGVLGLYHGVQTQAAMYILGVASTPALIAVTALTGAIWVGGSLMC